MVRYYLYQIEQTRHLNAFLEVFEEEALAKAHALDIRIKNGEPVGALAGIVIGIKDVICYKGHKALLLAYWRDSHLCILLRL
jgi:aspartyl-tRNA(Asn)/glutamyl-tRNA(Gln) amidotransferase subunit A